MDLVEKYLLESSVIDPYYFNMIHKSSSFKKIERMGKKDLIKRLGFKLFVQKSKNGRLMDFEKEIARRKYSKTEMAYLLYNIEYSDGKVPE